MAPHFRGRRTDRHREALAPQFCAGAAGSAGFTSSAPVDGVAAACDTGACPPVTVSLGVTELPAGAGEGTEGAGGPFGSPGAKLVAASASAAASAAFLVAAASLLAFALALAADCFK